MQSPILGSAYVARSVNAADNRCVNLYPEVVPEGGKQAAFLNRAPGLRRLATIGNGPVRGLWATQITGSDGYVVSGNGLYKIDTAYNATFLGTIDGTGPVSIADNGTQIFIAANPNGKANTVCSNLMNSAQRRTPENIPDLNTAQPGSPSPHVSLIFIFILI